MGSRRTPLTRERIAAAGVALADAEGIDALTMRRLAATFNTSAMAFYRHVSDRDDLLVAMVDTIIRERLPDFTEDVGWDEAISKVALADWRAFTQHPWLIKLWSTPRRRVEMASFDQLERLLRQLEDVGVCPAQSYAIVQGALGLTIGMAAMTIEDRGAASSAEMDIQTFWQDSVTRCTPTFAATHPRSTQFMTGLHNSGGHAAFLSALDGLLDGIAHSHGLPRSASTARAQV